MLTQKLLRLFDRLLFIPALILVIGPVQTAAAAVAGDFYVSGVGDDVNGDGSEANPWRTISHAVAQAGGGHPTIMVGPGQYSTSQGEQFPIDLGQHDDAGITIVGAGWVYEKGDIPNWSIIGFGLEAPLIGVVPDVFVCNGIIDSVNISDLVVTASAAVTDFSSKAFLDVGQGVVSLQLEHNLIAGMQLFDGQLYDIPAELESVDVRLNDNIVIGARNAVQYDVSQNVDAVAQMSLEVRGNQFSDAEDAALRIIHNLNGLGGFDVLVESNEILDCEEGILAFTEFWQESDGTGDPITASWTIQGNSISVEDTGICFSFSEWGVVDEFGPQVNQRITIVDNDIVVDDGVCLEFRTEWSSPAAECVSQQVLISNNELTGDHAVEQRARGEMSGGQRQWTLSNNVVDARVGFELGNSSSALSSLNSSGELGSYSVLVDGNAITASDYGLSFYNYYSGVNNDVDVTITRNSINAGETGLYWGMTASDAGAPVDVDLMVRGNVFQTDDNHVYLSNYSSLDIVQDFGSVDLLGYNTFDAVSSSASTSVFFLSDTNSTSLSAENLMVGNWWGTQDAGVIEGRVFHGADGDGFTTNLTLPLADALTYSVSQPGRGSKVRLTAGDGSGFVPYAGELDISVTVDGVAAEEVTVADDYASLTFKNNYGGQEVEICVTNPGGQSGCVTATISEVESGGGGCGVMPVGGGTPTAQDFFAQYFLLLFPALFLMRRRISGVRPQPVGYVG